MKFISIQIVIPSIHVKCHVRYLICWKILQSFVYAIVLVPIHFGWLGFKQIYFPQIFNGYLQNEKNSHK